MTHFRSSRIAARVGTLAAVSLVGMAGCARAADATLPIPAAAAALEPPKVLRLRGDLRIDAAAGRLSVNEVLMEPVAGRYAACAERSQTLEPGTARVGRFWVERQLRDCGTHRWRWSGPMTARVDRTRGPGHDTVEAAAAEAVRAVFGADVQVEVASTVLLDEGARAQGAARAPAQTQARPEVVDPGRAVTFRAWTSTNAAGGLPAVEWLRVDRFVAGQWAGRSTLEVRLHRWADVWVTRRTLSPDEPLQSDDVEAHSRDIAGLRAPMLAQGPWTDDWRAHGPLAAGEVLTRARIHPRPDVARGAPVTATATAGRVQLALQGVAVQEGGVGQWIRVRLPGQRSTVVAKVTADRQVEIK